VGIGRRQAFELGTINKRMKPLICFIIISLSQTSCFGQSEEVREIQRFSEEIKFLDMREFVYNRTFRFNTNSSLNRFLEFSDSLSIEEIENCLRSNNGKIKTLGILGLYQTDNQKNFLRIASFLADSTISFKASPYNIFDRRISFGESQSSEEELLSKAKNLYVSDVANSIIRHYFKQSGHIYFDDEFPRFLSERKNLDYTAGFLKVLKLKATGGINPFQEDRILLANNLRSRINSIQNEVDRAIYKMYLSTNEYELFTHNEIINELRFLGKERVRRILVRQPPTSDPDLLSINDSELHNFEYNRMCKWILLNAKELFFEEDVPFFLERAKYERENTGYWGTTLSFPFWHIAAARVDEVNSSKYLKSCIVLFEGENQEFERATLYAELWHRRGVEEADFILDWIYDSYALNERSRERIDIFIHNLDHKEDIILLKKIISDDRFENSMNVWNVIQVAWQLNKLKGDSTIEDHLTRKIWHPFGLDRVEWWRESALEKYPNETMEMLERTETLINELKKVE
jgi:hypothetical protein